MLPWIRHKTYVDIIYDPASKIGTNTSTREICVQFLGRIAYRCAAPDIQTPHVQCSSVLGTRISTAKTAEPIEMSFGRLGIIVWAQVRNRLLYGVCIWAPPDKYDWTISARRRCGRVSDYCDHLLINTFVGCGRSGRQRHLSSGWCVVAFWTASASETTRHCTVHSFQSSHTAILLPRALRLDQPLGQIVMRA